MKKEVSFTSGFDMFYYIVDKYEVIAFSLRPWLFCKEKILADKGSLLIKFLEESLCFIDSFLRDVNTRYSAALFGEGKQIAALAAAYFQYSSAVRQIDVCIQVFYVEHPGCVCQFAEILFAVQVSLLHRLFLFCFSIG